MGTKIVLKNVRFSYCNLFKARAMDENAKPKFSVSLIIPKDHPQLPEVKAAIKAETEVKWPDPKKRPGGLHNPLRDGDADRPNDEAYAGSFFINSSANVDYPPGVFDYEKRKVEDLTYWNSGDYGNASVNFYSFDVSAKKGVACGLNGVQFIRKGEPLGGRGNVAADFDVEQVADGDTAFD